MLPTICWPRGGPVRGNQVIAVVPEENLVAVRLGPVNKTPEATAFNQATLVEGALAALDK